MVLQGFNILGPALNQVGNMSDKSKKSVALGLGMTTLLMAAAEQADAATEVRADFNRLGNNSSAEPRRAQAGCLGLAHCKYACGSVRRGSKG